MDRLFAALTEGPIVDTYLEDAPAGVESDKAGGVTCDHCSNVAKSAGGSCSCSDSCSNKFTTWV